MSQHIYEGKVREVEQMTIDVDDYLDQWNWSDEKDMEVEVDEVNDVLKKKLKSED